METFLHFYQHHIGDFIRDTSRLSDQQAMAYLRLLWMYYDTEKPLPDDAATLAFKIGSNESTVRLLLSSFFSLDSGVWRHGRCDEEIKKYHDYIEAQRERGKLGGRPKQSKGKPTALPRETQGFTTDKPEESHGKPGVNPNRKPLTENQINNPLPPSGAVVGFSEFWEAWPASDRKQAKGKCLEAWKKSGCEKVKDEIIRHVGRMKACEDWRKNGGAFIPAPLVYLNQRRWEGAGESVSTDIFAGAI